MNVENLTADRMQETYLDLRNANPILLFSKFVLSSRLSKRVGRRCFWK